MSEVKEIFADGVTQIHLTGDMMRFDFMTFQTTEDGQDPVPETSLRLVMPPQGFANMLKTMLKLTEALALQQKAVLEKANTAGKEKKEKK